MQPETHHEATVVVHEGHQVHAPPLALEREGEQVCLPQLVRTRAFETSHLGRVWPRRRLFDHPAFFRQHPPDRAGARAVAFGADQNVVDALLAPVGVCLFEHHDRPTTHFREAAAPPCTTLSIGEARRAFRLEARPPFVERGHRNLDHLGELARRELGADPRVEDQQPLLRRVLHTPGSVRLAHTTPCTASTARPPGRRLLLAGGSIRIGRRLGAAAGSPGAPDSGTDLGFASLGAGVGRTGRRAVATACPAGLPAGLYVVFGLGDDRIVLHRSCSLRLAAGDAEASIRPVNSCLALTDFSGRGTTANRDLPPRADSC